MTLYINREPLSGVTVYFENTACTLHWQTNTTKKMFLLWNSEQ